MIKQIDVSTLKKWLENDEVFLIDVREISEFNEANIAGSTLMPLGEIKLSEIIAQNNKGKKIAIHCRSGKRSLAACDKLLDEDSKLELYNVEGGILEWQRVNK